ncbi:TetR/AcrR family transcriptional regulator [Mycobacterium sp. CVI_P3]|uniref:TetR/AcrR family transcriptional regulator n=1 Tax=Mycobacterium pinniadriaticum TaxID=2994102 RepID=A0ABT3SK88_9MYCO|nr:TetR/AcrR family transcriptional regulator [Mycobacterium pinniadriaticum]MCX2933563.1 TetR/AcrR family transcriptional regulator [Mycobacterium pinniadriaticum]MCX2939936.1 TetR/AcrR family transcriptional regulator [Mycobacterium pinniadriaticum]
MRRRPKDRKAQIARASADAFGSQGYHAVSMEDIATRVGITPAALYRHSPSKYDLFRDAVLDLVQLLVDATAFADDLGDDDPAMTLGALIDVLIDTTIANRTAGGLYRWEARYLRGPDRVALAEQLKAVNHRLQRPLLRLRPKLSPSQRWTLSSAALSVIGSITDHTNLLAAGDIRSCLSTMAADVLAAELPPTRRRPAPWPEPIHVGAEAGMYEHVLYEAVRLFYEHGYRNTSMEDIASAVGIQASGLYRSFPGKADILALAYRRAADRHSSDTADALSRNTEPVAALDDLIDEYLGRVMEFPDLAYVYYTERHSVPEADLRVVETIEHSTVDAWARLVTTARPEMKVGAARYAVGAAFALTVDFRRLFDPTSGGDSVATLRRLMEVTLLGRPVVGR